MKKCSFSSQILRKQHTDSHEVLHLGVCSATVRMICVYAYLFFDAMEEKRRLAIVVVHQHEGLNAGCCGRKISHQMFLCTVRITRLVFLYSDKAICLHYFLYRIRNSFHRLRNYSSCIIEANKQPAFLSLSLHCSCLLFCTVWFSDQCKYCSHWTKEDFFDYMKKDAPGWCQYIQGMDKTLHQSLQSSVTQHNHLSHVSANKSHVTCADFVICRFRASPLQNESN